MQRGMQHSQLAYEKAILRFIALVALKKNTHTRNCLFRATSQGKL